MANPEPGKTPTGFASDENIIDLVMKRYQKSATYHQTIYEKFKRFYDLFRGITTRRFPQHRNNVHLPFPLAVVQSDIALKAQATFGNTPIATFSGYGQDDNGSAKRNETLITAQLSDNDSFSKAVDLLTSMDVHGTGIIKVGWTTKVEEEYYRILNPEGAETLDLRKVITFDGPDFEVLDILDTFPQPTIKRLDDMAWFIYRYYLDLDDIERRAILGAYDMSAVKELKSVGMGSTTSKEMVDRRSFYRSEQDWEARQSEAFAKPVELIEYWGMVPNEFAPDGVINRVITVANGNVLLRNRPHPFFIKKKPFLAACPMNDPFFFHGIGKIEPIIKLAIASDRIASQKLDALEIFQDPVFFANSQLGLDKQNLIMRAGKVFTTDGPVDESQLRALSPDLRGLQTAYVEIESMWKWIQQATGVVEDTIMGAGGAGGRETATGFAGRTQSAGTRLMLETMLFERSIVEPLVNYMRALNRQFLKLPHMVKILGPSAFTNPITGFPLPPEPTIIDHSDVNMDYRARAQGATQMLSRQMKRQDWATLQQLMQTNPALLQMINWYAFGKEAFARHDVPDPNQFFNQQSNPVNVAGAQDGGEGMMMGQGGEMNPAEQLPMGG